VSSSSTALNIKIIGVLAVLGVIGYLIMLLDDMNYGMDLVRSTIEA
jgi:preprotein translocase subunit Sss1